MSLSMRCCFCLALQWTGDLSREYPASRLPWIGWSRYRKWMDERSVALLTTTSYIFFECTYSSILPAWTSGRIELGSAWTSDPWAHFGQSCSILLVGWGVPVRDWHVLDWVFTGCSGFLPESKDMNIDLIDNSKLVVGINMFRFLYSCVLTLLMERQTIQGAPVSISQCQGDTVNKNKWV